MATNYPGSLDSYSTKAASDTIAEGHINDPQNAIEAIEAKVGTGASTPTAGTTLYGNGTGTSAWAAVPPTGTISMWGGAIASPPTGWLICDGSVVSTSTYAALYAVIAHIYASDPGGGNFTLPNFSNRFPYGANEGAAAGNASVGSARARTELAGNDNSVTISLTGIGHNVADDGAHVYVVDTMPPYLAVAFIIKT